MVLFWPCALTGKQVDVDVPILVGLRCFVTFYAVTFSSAVRLTTKLKYGVSNCFSCSQQSRPTVTLSAQWPAMKNTYSVALLEVSR